ncbi:MAG: hypothetical protein LJF06_17435 [Gemmatimonadetes bacterium]|jgi:hypothetical protein|nr:hypothetical protein [Gemmatimonadota bacterium]
MFMVLLVAFVPLIIVPLGLTIAFSFRHAHGCDACTAESYSCGRREAGKLCPFFD